MLPYSEACTHRYGQVSNRSIPLHYSFLYSQPILFPPFIYTHLNAAAPLPTCPMPTAPF